VVAVVWAPRVVALRVSARGPVGKLTSRPLGAHRVRTGRLTEKGASAMTDIWSYTSKDWTGDKDLVGYDVEATDGSIGKIDESTAEAGRQQVVVDTGFWIFGKKRLIPAGAIKKINHTDEKVFVGLTKDQIKEAPDFDETRRDEEDFRTNHERYYDPYRTRV
jgi:hypothetical protein